MQQVDATNRTHRTYRAAVAAVCACWLIACATTETARTKDGLVPVAGLSVAKVREAARPRRVALLVGVNNFDDSFWPPLLYAAKDAQDLAQILKDPKIGGFDEVIVLATPEQTTKKNVLATIQGLAALAPRAQDTLLLYISSHGTLLPTVGGSFQRAVVLQDTQQKELALTTLTMDQLTQSFDALPSRRKAMILATCHSGSGKSLLTEETAQALKGLKGNLPSMITISRASLVFSASEFGQPAREDDRLENDVYTHFLMQALTLRADGNGDGAISATEAHDFARRRTYEFTEGKQVPTVQATVIGEDPVVFSGDIQQPGLPVLYSYAPALEGYEVRIQGRTKGVFPGSVVLPDGHHQLELVRGDQVAFEGPLTLDQGERLAADVLLNRAFPRWSVGMRYSGWALLDPELNNQTLGPLHGPGLSLRLRNTPYDHIDPMVDFTVSQMSQSIQPGDFAVTQDVWFAKAGVAVAAAKSVRWFRFYGGPHVAALYLHRTLRAREPEEVQTYATLLPGVVGGVAFQYYLLELQLEGQLHYVPLMLDEELRSTAAGTVTAGAALRF